MPFKTLSRRTFLTASSALAFLHTPFARALSARQSVNINDYNPHDWIASFKQAFSEGQTVVVPGGLVCDNINTGIFIPPGKTLHILGSLRGNGRGRFVLQDGSQVTGEEGGSMHNITLDVRGSDCTIKGLAMSGFGPVTQIYIGGKNKRVMRNLTIDNLTVSHANYAILRQGFHNQIIGANITNCKFSDLQGDAIEWNVAINDRDILISDHVIERINCTNGKINWGIGIGLAGSTYDNSVKRQLLAEVQSICPPGVTIMNVRQGEPLGLGHSILCARPAIGDNPFVVVLPDVVIDDASADPLRYNLAAMIARFNETGRSQVLAKRMPGDLSEYSVIQTKEPLDREGKVSRIVEFIEKPDQPQTLDSDIMAVGRYVLSADIWPELERTQPGAWGRIQLTDAIAELAKKHAVDAMLMTGDSYDCGKKMGYMQAFVKYGLRNIMLGTKFRGKIEEIIINDF